MAFLVGLSLRPCYLFCCFLFLKSGSVFGLGYLGRSPCPMFLQGFVGSLFRLLFLKTMFLAHRHDKLLGFLFCVLKHLFRQSCPFPLLHESEGLRFGFVWRRDNCRCLAALLERMFLFREER